ncbi:MAG: discoidin domain-containing protein [Lentisphaeria bacterium]|nr:discoidin domain-containing protein [Lentisphaeria bacterium]
MKKLCLMSTLLIAGLAPALLNAAEPGNIALNKKYTLTKKPNYKLCTDAGDAVQLTNGTVSKGTAWADKETVGWFYQAPVGIDVDLEKNQAIGGATLRIAGGTSGVTFPDHIFLYVSDDNASWSYAGELEYTGSTPARYHIRKYALSGLRAGGRYVRLEIHTKGAYVFADELEILGTAAEPVAAFPENSNIKNTIKFSQELIKQKNAPKLSGTNLALNKKYTFSKNANYWNCTDRGDWTQLTDGKYTKGDFWTSASTVGWSHSSPLEITIDLEKSEPISGITFNSAAGRAQVTFPQQIGIYVSDDGKVWDYACDLIETGAKHGTPSNTVYNVFKFTDNTLSVRGRYVKFYLITQFQYMFCDEIEIHRGSDSQEKKVLKSGITDPKEHALSVFICGQVKNRVKADLEAIQKMIAALPESARSAAEAAGKDLKNKISAIAPDPYISTYKAYIPLNDVHAEIFALNRFALQNAGYSKPFLWNKNRWAILDITEIPAKAPLKPLAIEMMRNEVRADVINITNPTDKAITYTVSVKGLPENANPVLKELLYTDTREKKAAAAALKAAPVNKTLTTVVPAGCTRQIWVSMEKPTAKAGDYKAQVIASAKGQADLKADLNLKIHDLDFPETVSLHVGGWSYSHNWTGKKLEENLKIMKEISVDSPWADYRIAPGGAKFGKDGKLLNPDELNFTKWDAWQKCWPNVRNYCIFWGGWNSFGGFHRSSQEFQQAVGDYVKAWVKQIRKNNKGNPNLVFLLCDEPRSKAHYDITIQYSKAVHRAGLGVRIYSDPIPKNHAELPEEMMKQIDIYCPNFLSLLAGSVDVKYIRGRQNKGSELWLYSCHGPAKFLDPIFYHRVQAWRSFSLGGTASCFWQFGCAGGSVNNLMPYTQSGTDYSPYFWDGELMMHGKHSEAIRESIQDFEYLVMLKKKIASSDPATAAKLQKICDDAINKVVAALSKEAVDWNNKNNHAVTDEAAVAILRALK